MIHTLKNTDILNLQHTLVILVKIEEKEKRQLYTILLHVDHSKQVKKILIHSYSYFPKVVNYYIHQHLDYTGPFCNRNQAELQYCCYNWVYPVNKTLYILVIVLILLL